MKDGLDWKIMWKSVALIPKAFIYLIDDGDQN